MDNLEEIRSFLQITPQIATAGQPTTEQFALVKEAGYHLVINLALTTSTDAIANEAEIVASKGITYTHIPIVWEEPTLNDLERFFAVMDANGNANIFVHCAANMRVSAFVYLYRVIRQNIDQATAKQDLAKIWTPNPIWQKFMDLAIAHYRSLPIN